MIKRLSIIIIAVVVVLGGVFWFVNSSQGGKTSQHDKIQVVATN